MYETLLIVDVTLEQKSMRNSTATGQLMIYAVNLRGQVRRLENLVSFVMAFTGRAAEVPWDQKAKATGTLTELMAAAAISGSDYAQWRERAVERNPAWSMQRYHTPSWYELLTSSEAVTFGEGEPEAAERILRRVVGKIVRADVAQSMGRHRAFNFFPMPQGAAFLPSHLNGATEYMGQPIESWIEAARQRRLDMFGAAARLRLQPDYDEDDDVLTPRAEDPHAF